MAKPKDIARLIGRRFKDSRLTILGRAGYDSSRHPLVLVRCQCGAERVVRLSHVLSGHTKSHGCLKHETYVQHMQAVTAGLRADTVLECFVAACQGRAAKLKMKKDLVDSAYHRRVAELKALPKEMMQSITRRVLHNESYDRIATDHDMHGAEIAWLAKHIIGPRTKNRARRPEAESTIVRLKDIAIRQIEGAKMDLEEQRRDRFYSTELSGAKKPRKAKLGYAWSWTANLDSSIELTDQESELVRWFLLTAERTFNIRKTERKERLEARKRKANQTEPTSSSTGV